MPEDLLFAVNQADLTLRWVRLARAVASTDVTIGAPVRVLVATPCFVV